MHEELQDLAYEEKENPNHLNLTHRNDLEIEDILLKLQQVTEDSRLPEDLAE